MARFRRSRLNSQEHGEARFLKRAFLFGLAADFWLCFGIMPLTNNNPAGCETAVLKPPQSRRSATSGDRRAARSVWTAAVDRRFRPPGDVDRRESTIVCERHDPTLFPGHQTFRDCRSNDR